jgi:hypothetical protein
VVDAAKNAGSREVGCRFTRLGSDGKYDHRYRWWHYRSGDSQS